MLGVVPIVLVSFRLRSVSFCYKKTIAEEVKQQKSLIYAIAASLPIKKRISD